jgi:hypothetical protein
MSKEKTQNQNTDFDFENAEIVCSVKLSDFEKSEFKCRQNTNGKYYLLCLPSLHMNICSYTMARTFEHQSAPRSNK